MFWKSETYKEAKAFIDAHLKAGFVTYEELNELAFEQYGLNELLSKREERALEHYLYQSYLHHLDEQEDWGATPYDALETVFAELRTKHQLFANVNYGVSQKDAARLIDRQVIKDKYDGYVFFHKQDTYFLGKEEAVYLSYGSFTRGISHPQAGQQIKELLEGYGYKVEWNGKLNTRLKLLIPGWKKKIDF
jgi:hypothetical protein